MAQILPLRPTVIEAAHNIAASFAQADKARDKARSMRVQIGLDLIDLQRRVEAGEAGQGTEFWGWVKQFCHRSRADMRKCIALARSDDPEAAAAQEREDDRVRKSAARGSLRPPVVESFDIVDRALDLVRRMTEQERERFLAQLREQYQWFGTERRR